MEEHLAWQLLFTRWVILFVVAFIIGIFTNGVTTLIAKNKEPYKGVWLWPIVFIALSGVHVGGFLYRHSLPHWVLSTSAGLLVSLGSTLLIRWIFDLVAVKANVIAAILSCITFAIVANFTQAEEMLISWFKAF